MCIEGKGNETIARILQERQVLVPMAYWQSKGLDRGGKKTQANPYKWCKTTIAKILAQQLHSDQSEERDGDRHKGQQLRFLQLHGSYERYPQRYRDKCWNKRIQELQCN